MGTTFSGIAYINREIYTPYAGAGGILLVQKTLYGLILNLHLILNFQKISLIQIF